MEEAVLREAERRCVADAARERSTCGVLPPCRSIDPLHPPLSQDEYEMMERDTAKYGPAPAAPAPAPPAPAPAG